MNRRRSRLETEIGALTAHAATPCLIGMDGEQIEIPPSIFHALRLAVDAMAAGHTVTLMPLGKEMTSQEAADLLLVARPHLIKLLDRGEIPYRRVGRHRRILIDDVLAYRERRETEREATLQALAQDAQDADAYS